jgi:hypothetical protein
MSHEGNRKRGSPVATHHFTSLQGRSPLWAKERLPSLVGSITQVLTLKYLDHYLQGHEIIRSMVPLIIEDDV